jgi:hypothetical protein
MGQELVKRWEAANLAMTGKLRIGGSRPTPVDKSKAILAEEAAAWEALNHALPQASRVEATGLRVEALAAQNLEVGEDTNSRLELLQRQVDQMGAQTEEFLKYSREQRKMVFDGVLPDDLTASQAVKAVRFVKAPLTSVRETAMATIKEEQDKAHEVRAAAK